MSYNEITRITNPNNTQSWNEITLLSHKSCMTKKQPRYAEN
jgi:hypothetical protein